MPENNAVSDSSEVSVENLQGNYLLLLSFDLPQIHVILLFFYLVCFVLLRGTIIRSDSYWSFLFFLLAESIENIKIEDADNDLEGGALLPHSNNVISVKEMDAIVQNGRAVPDCIYFLKHGICGYGSNCRYNHSVRGQVCNDIVFYL